MIIDMVNRPPHYNKGKVECIDALEAATCDLKGIEAICTANAIKYLWRWRQKNGIEDLKKSKVVYQSSDRKRRGRKWKAH